MEGYLSNYSNFNQCDDTCLSHYRYQILIIQAKPIARWGRKATGPYWIAGLHFSQETLRPFFFAATKRNLLKGGQKITWSILDQQTTRRKGEHREHTYPEKIVISLCIDLDRQFGFRSPLEIRCHVRHTVAHVTGQKESQRCGQRHQTHQPGVHQQGC